MSNHLKTIRDTIGEDRIRAGGEAIGLGVAVTDDEVVIARRAAAGGRGTVERLRLDTITQMRVLPNPHANFVEIEFAGRPPKNVSFMYDARTAKELDAVIDILRGRAANPAAGSKIPPPEVSPPVAAAPQDEATATTRNRIILLLMLVPLVGLYFAQVFLR